MTAEEFYRARDSRSASYLRTDNLGPSPVRIVWGADAAQSAAGQVLLASTINQIARFARRISFSGPDAPMRVPCLVQRETLHDSLIDSARAIDPFGTFEISVERDFFTLGVGADAPAADIFVGSYGWAAVITQDRDAIPRFNACPIGAAVASCIATSHALAASLNLASKFHVGAFSCLTWATADELASEAGTSETADLGSALMIGAGAVASAFAYWAKTFQITAAWDVVDKDMVDISNTNRGMLFTAAHGGFNGPQASKADVVARWLGNATTYDMWYHEFIDAGLAERRWDITFPLANDYNARGEAQSQYPAIMLHATTGEHWETFLHRHRPGRDGCITCRFPPSLPTPSCATGQVERIDGSTADAALPFMSAAAGLMLAVDCLRLAANQLNEDNFLTLDWSGTLSVNAGIQRCASDCRRWGDALVRESLNRSTRWFSRI